MADNTTGVRTAKDSSHFLSLQNYLPHLQNLYQADKVGRHRFNPATLENSKDEILGMDLYLRKQFHLFLLGDAKKELADFFDDRYLIKTALREPNGNWQVKPSSSGLAERVKSAKIELSVAYAAALYETSIKAKYLNPSDESVYKQLLQGLSRNAKLAIHRRLEKLNSAAANYFSGNFMFGGLG